MKGHVWRVTGLKRLVSSVAVASSAIVFVFSGCGAVDDIPLKGGSANTPGENRPEPAPKDPLNTGGGTTEPRATPLPVPLPRPARYRALCQSPGSNFLAAVSSLAGPLDMAAQLFVGPANTEGGEFDPVFDNSIENHFGPVAVSWAAQDVMRALFAADTIVDPIRPGVKGKNIYASDIGLLMRRGTAVSVGAFIESNARLTALADATHVALRPFGASDEGRFFFVGTSEGYDVLKADTRARTGSLKIGTAKQFVNPFYRESDRLFTYSEADAIGAAGTVGATWTTHLATVELDLRGGFARLKKVATVSGLARPLTALRRPTGTASRAGDLFYALSGDRSALVIWDQTLRREGRIRLVNPPKKSAVVSAAALHLQRSGELVLTTVIEDVDFVANGRGGHYRVNEAALHRYIVDSSASTAAQSAALPDIPYPTEAKRAIETRAISGAPGLTDLQVTGDGEALFGLFPAANLKRIYRVESEQGWVSPVSQQTCAAISLLVE